MLAAVKRFKSPGWLGILIGRAKGKRSLTQVGSLPRFARLRPNFFASDSIWDDRTPRLCRSLLSSARSRSIFLGSMISPALA
jgi:hypothetical protein